MGRFIKYFLLGLVCYFAVTIPAGLIMTFAFGVEDPRLLWWINLPIVIVAIGACELIKHRRRKRSREDGVL